MRAVIAVILAGTLLGLVAPPSFAGSDWVEIKDPNELRALYSNKTFRGNGWIGHYRADGTGVVVIQGSQPVRRTWTVKGRDQVCVTPEMGSVQCFTFKYASDDRKSILLTNVATSVSLLFAVEDGIQKF